MSSKRFLILFFMATTIQVVLGQYVSNSSEENLDNWPERQYNLTIEENLVNFTGKEVHAMTINGGIPGPNLEFTEGEFAIINVTNRMEVETSVHWHGIILPNFFDGVPYLTTPPIQPGETQQYRFALKQSGTYWYHSHTGLQEQRGVYGSIQIKPKDPHIAYDKELVLVLSDWMDESPMSQLKNLKRGNEWYLIKKDQVQSWDKVIRKGAVKSKLRMMWDRMPDMAILDNYYDLFLVNGQPTQAYPDFKPGERVRLRIINAAAASYFWITFGGETPLLIAADGLDVIPVAQDKTLISVAETYDFLITIPENGKMEVLATSQDGSGSASAWLGKGKSHPASKIPTPDLIHLMKQMTEMNMKMGAPAAKYRPGVNDSIAMMKTYAMEMPSSHPENMHPAHNVSEAQENSTRDSFATHGHANTQRRDSMKMAGMMDSSMKMGYTIPADKVIGSAMKTGGNPEFNYNYLKSEIPTIYEKDKPVREMLFNLTGNMNRYVWSINGIPLSETDKIKIKQGEIVRITLNNLTMMHHPMHLHGHFFRVLNEHGEYSPLKHTVNVAPMQKVVIEFDANEYGDWFFHCHILYHMNSGMARVFSYGTPRDKRLENYPLANLTTEANHLWKWGEITTTSHMTEVFLTATNIRNQLSLLAEVGYNKNLEASVSYERWLNSYFRVFGGVQVENEITDEFTDMETSAIAGIRYLLPLLIDSELRIDHRLRPAVSINTETMLTRRVALFGEYEYEVDFGWITNVSGMQGETNWRIGLEYVLGRNFSLSGNYDNRFDWGAGLSIKF